MTTTTTGPPARTAARQPLPPQWISTGPRRPAGVRAGQLVATQLAVALPVAALGRGTLPMAVALTLTAALLPGTWWRLRGRWLFEWLGVGLSYLGRRRALNPTAGPTALLDLVSPGATVRPAELAGGPAAVVDDATGLATLLELGDPTDLFADGPRPLPVPPDLLPPATADNPPVRIQLLLTGVPAPATDAGGGTVATSYRQLTDGRLPAQARAVLVVRVLRTDGWSDQQLRRALSGVVRRLVRRFQPVTARPLGPQATLRLLGEYAHHEGELSTRESWSAVHTGPLTQATFRLRRWPDPPADGGGHLVPRLLALPATACTVSLCAGPHPGVTTASTELTVRLAGWTPAELTVAAQALRRLVDALGGAVDRLDGEHLTGLAGTLPLALPGVRTANHRTDGGTASGRNHGSAASGGPDAGRLAPTLDDAGLMVGANRHGGAVTVRVFRAEHTRIVLVGGIRGAQLVVLRAMALGARVVVRTARPRLWEPFVRAVGSPGGTIPLLPPGRSVDGVAGSPLRPSLVVIDAGPVPVDRTPAPAWQTTLVVRDELTPADADLLGRADLAVLQPLGPGEATLAGTALGLGGSADWLTRIRHDMVAVVNRRALRWALLSPTPIEAQLIGPPARR
ncbi:type VII secretion protein EccE [Micromonospora yangpuensis]|uniref:Type VII secretion protein EccE n=1 Tax=Micromonospora yangpuensis TaxID=683228 RepID=A0A1C6U038_9ACTN|nr:type VII secretion protein EccE [Micromonospora yangpuensis]GGM21511.1 hypothetical protein GCM10012279_44830 [Micromonospora yangpuensis]SCL47283.1 type VII secretion protein EccE [Micromonospora yangpuensis]